jgi:small subunit ribosomal protein S9
MAEEQEPRKDDQQDVIEQPEAQGEQEQPEQTPPPEAPTPEAPDAAPAADAETPAEETPAEETPAEAPAAEEPAAEAPAVDDAPAADSDEAPESADTPETVDVAVDTAEAAEDQPPEPVVLAADARYFATGKRKSSVARVIIRPGSGGFELNGRSLETFFPRPKHQAVVRQPLEATGYTDRLDIRARIHGGGISGQADAVRHGIAKALIEADPNLRGELKRRQFLTRDPRVKERKKAGLKKARKRPQFSKR